MFDEGIDVKNNQINGFTLISGAIRLMVLP